MNALTTRFSDAKDFQSNSGLLYTDREYTRLEGIGHIVGRTCLHVRRHTDGDDMISMIFDDGSFAVMLHHQDCCEDVSIEDINGDLDDLMGQRINVAEERTQDDPNAGESATWTFYCLRTIKGSVDIRWYGQSNGYYGETASFDIRQPAVPLSNHERAAFVEQVKAWTSGRPG